MEALGRHDTALTGMVTAVADLSCGDPVELIDHITELERLKNAAAAAQARLTVELRQVREAEARAEGRNVKRVPVSVAGEIGLARHESPHRASTLVSLAAVLTSEMPTTMAAFTAGEISEWHTTVLARETACLSRTHRALIDAELGPKLAELSIRQVAAEARKLAYELDPNSVIARIGQAEADRNVTIRPAPDCMTRVSALLPVAQGVAAYAALTAAAGTARAAGDERSKNQVMADTLVARVTGEEEAGEVDIEIQLVITDEALLGWQRNPGPDQRPRAHPCRHRPRTRRRRHRQQPSLGPSALRPARQRSAGHHGIGPAPLPQGNEGLHQGSRRGLPDAVVRGTHPAHRPHHPGTCRRNHQPHQRPGPVRTVQPAQGASRLAAQPPTGRHQHDPNTHRPPVSQPATRPAPRTGLRAVPGGPPIL